MFLMRRHKSIGQAHCDGGQFAGVRCRRRKTTRGGGGHQVPGNLVPGHMLRPVSETKMQILLAGSSSDEREDTQGMRTKQIYL